MNLGYKVVLELNGKITSVATDVPFLPMEYEVGKWTRWRKYGPFIFEDIMSAINFRVWSEDIWLCEYVGRVPYRLIVDVGALPKSATKRQIIQAMDYGSHEILPMRYAPRGTIITNKIRLLERIEWQKHYL